MGDSKSLIHELLQGLELTRQLQLYLNVPSSSSNETRELLIQQIITTFEKALQMVNRKGHVAESSQQQQPARTVGIRMLDSPPLSCSPKSEDSDRDFQDHHRNAFKKRYVKTLSTHQNIDKNQLKNKTQNIPSLGPTSYSS